MRVLLKDSIVRSHVVIIGGGAAGLSAAIAAARRGATVTILEAGTRVGRKILASGNGRCNLTNISVSPDAYNHPDFVEPVLSRYPYDAIRDFFGSMGLLMTADPEGRVYPVTNAASSVLDVLRLECDRSGVEVRCGFEVDHISQDPHSHEFEVSSHDGQTLRTDSVVVATGVSMLAAHLGHEMLHGVPVLGPVRTDTEPIRGLSGVRVKCAATLLVDGDADETVQEVVATEAGELLFREYGVSGIMVFDLSRHLVPGCAISLDFFPNFAPEELRSMIAQRCAYLSWRTAETFFVGMLHDRLARAILRVARISFDTPVAGLPQDRLATLLKDFRLDVTGMGDAAQAQVTRGGASVTEFDPNTMASHRVVGLFAAGEVLDVDGRCGGFNLHWAWASGMAAGEAAADLARHRPLRHEVSSRGSE